MRRSLLTLMALLLCSTAMGAASSTPISLGPIEARILVLVNAQRANAGLGTLAASPQLAQAARGHSQEMIRLNYFSHDSPTAGYETVEDRVARAGVDADEIAENIAETDGYGGSSIAQHMVSDWMNSPDHRENILTSSYTMAGVGLASKGRKVLATMVFSSALTAGDPGMRTNKPDDDDDDN